MDLRAFGSTYPYRGEVPYTSGFGIVPPTPSGTPIRFSTCRAIFIEAKSGGAGGYLAVELSDAPGQVAAAGNLKGDQLLPLSCTAIISGDVTGVFLLS
jgi:hypothetical protein